MAGPSVCSIEFRALCRQQREPAKFPDPSPKHVASGEACTPYCMYNPSVDLKGLDLTTSVFDHRALGDAQPKAQLKLRVERALLAL